MNAPKQLLEATNKSGFPLQIAVEQLVKKTCSNHGWSVRHLEHAWFHPLTQEGGFIDLVLQKDTSNLVIECKRVREASWLFLRSDGTEKEQNRCKGWVSLYTGGRMKAFGWHDLETKPFCVEAMFCTNQGQGNRGAQNMLEPLAANVVSSTEALAMEERDYRPEKEASRKFYFSVQNFTALLPAQRNCGERLQFCRGFFAFAPAHWISTQATNAGNGFDPACWQASINARLPATCGSARMITAKIFNDCGCFSTAIRADCSNR